MKILIHLLLKVQSLVLINILIVSNFYVNISELQNTDQDHVIANLIIEKVRFNEVIYMHQENKIKNSFLEKYYFFKYNDKKTNQNLFKDKDSLYFADTKITNDYKKSWCNKFSIIDSVFKENDLNKIICKNNNIVWNNEKLKNTILLKSEDYEQYPNKSIINITKPIYSKNNKIALVNLYYSGTSIIFILKKEKNIWIIQNSISGY